jgi:hypothetical protein
MQDGGVLSHRKALIEAAQEKTQYVGLTGYEIVTQAVP